MQGLRGPANAHKVAEQKEPYDSEGTGKVLLREGVLKIQEHIHICCGELQTALRGRRPISAAPHNPVPSFSVPGLRENPKHSYSKQPTYESVSIEKATTTVNSKYIKN